MAFDYTHGKLPKYVQLIRDIEEQIESGTLKPHQQLMSVRKTAHIRELNPNTVQKAYAILKKIGMIYSVAGKGDFVAEGAAANRKNSKEVIRDEFTALTKKARDAGFWTDEIFLIVDDAYSTR